MADESIVLRVGQEHPVKLPPRGGAADWTFRVQGMTSAVDVRKMWTSRPYEEDEDGQAGPVPPRSMVFVVRGTAAGEATVVFQSGQGDRYQLAVRVEP